MGPTIQLRNFASRVNRPFGPEPVFYKIFENLPENIRELDAIYFIAANAHQSLTFVQCKLRRGSINLCPINMLNVRISIALGAAVNPKEVPSFQFDSHFFPDFSHQCLFRILIPFQMAAEEIPVIRDRNVGVIVAKVRYCGRRAEPVRFRLSMKNRRVALNAITRLLPFDCRGRFGRDVVDDSVYSTHLIDDSIGNSRKQVGW